MSHEHKPALCDSWLLLGLITTQLERVKSEVRTVDLLKQCWHCVWSRLNKRNYIRVWTGLPVLPKRANRVETTTK